MRFHGVLCVWALVGFFPVFLFLLSDVSDVSTHTGSAGWRDQTGHGRVWSYVPHDVDLSRSLSFLWPKLLFDRVWLLSSDLLHDV